MTTANMALQHGGPNEHKGPSDFNGGADEDDDDDENGTPPHVDGLDPHMYPPHFRQPPYPLIRHQTPSASPPIPNGVFGGHPGNGPRGHTPQPQMGSRPPSRNDMQRMGPNMTGQPVGPPVSQPVNGFAYMAQPTMYNSQNPHNMSSNIPHGLPQPHSQYPYPQPQQHPHPHPHQMQPYVDEQRRGSAPNSFPHQPQGHPAGRHSVSPPQPPAAPLPSQLPSQPIPHMSPPPPQPQSHPVQSPPQPQQHLLPPPPPPQLQLPQESQVDPRPKSELVDRPRQPLLGLDTKIKQAPRGSIFTPIDEGNRSILSRHLAAFHPEPESDAPSSRSHSIDVGSVSRSSNTNSPPSLLRLNAQPQPQIKRNGSLGTIPETVFTPPSRSNSLRVGGSISRPRLTVQIPDESDGGSATNESGSPRGTTTAATDITSQHSRGVVLPPPSPSASTMLSAGATGPPNPFARPPPHQNNMNIDTPVSGLPSRFLGETYLGSPSGFYSELFAKSHDTNTLSPLNFGTPVGPGPSFLRDDPLALKRKSPDLTGIGGHHEPADTAASEAKRIKVDH